MHRDKNQIPVSVGLIGVGLVGTVLTGHFVANGGFKIGFGMAPKVGEVMADLLLDGVDRTPEDFRA